MKPQEFAALPREHSDPTVDIVRRVMRVVRLGVPQIHIDIAVELSSEIGEFELLLKFIEKSSEIDRLFPDQKS